MIAKTALVREDVKIGQDTKIWHYTNIYGCKIGNNCVIGSFVEITDGVTIEDEVTVSSHSFLCTGVHIHQGVFIGHGVMTINDLYPPSKKRTGKDIHWKPTVIKKMARIGSGAVLMPVTIGEYSVVGAGSVVTKDIPDGQVWAGNPAKYICDSKTLTYEDGTKVFPELEED